MFKAAFEHLLFTQDFFCPSNESTLLSHSLQTLPGPKLNKHLSRVFSKFLMVPAFKLHSQLSFAWVYKLLSQGGRSPQPNAAKTPPGRPGKQANRESPAEGKVLTGSIVHSLWQWLQSVVPRSAVMQRKRLEKAALASIPELLNWRLSVPHQLGLPEDSAEGEFESHRPNLLALNPIIIINTITWRTLSKYRCLGSIQTAWCH